MSSRLELELRRLEDALKAQENPVVAGMRPGLSEDEIGRILGACDIEPPDDLVAWFGWHNGYEVPAGSDFHGWIGPHLQQWDLESAALQHYPVIAESIAELRSFGWTSPDEHCQWFPLGSAPSAGTLVIDCRLGSGRGQLAVWDVHASGFSADAYRPPTLAEPVAWWADWLDAGIWKYNAQTGSIDRAPDYRERLSETQIRSRMI